MVSHSSTFSADILNSLKEATDQGFWLIDENGLTTDVNPAMCRLLGRKRAQIVGRTIYDFVDEDNRKIFEEELAARKLGKKGRYELSLLQPDGTNRPCINTAAAVFGPNHVKVGSVGIWTDISALKATQHELQIARAKLEGLVAEKTEELSETETALALSREALQDYAQCSSDWFWECDADMRFTYLSDRIRHVTGFGPEHFIGKKREELSMGVSVKGNWDLYYDKVSKREPFRDFNYKLLRNDGRTISVSTSGVPIFSSGNVFVGYRGSVSDVSERVRTEELRERAKIEAQQASASKSNFLAAMSHEIRTPMTGIMGMSDIILSDENLTEDQRSKVGSIKTAAESLLNIINDILDLSKLDAGKSKLESDYFTLSSEIDQITALLLPTATNKGLSLEVRIEDPSIVSIAADLGRLRQVLMNLIGNAIKFTEEGGISLVVSIQRGMLKFDVVDTGMGISEKETGRLFEEFYQAETNASQRFSGTGLGLSICKRLVELMGGKIGYAKNYERGSTFWFTIPYTKANIENIEADTAPDMASQLSCQKILVAEDNPMNQIVIKTLLETLGYTCEVVGSGKEAIDCVTSDPKRFDVILMDIRMPDMDGMEATRIIRKSGPALSSIPIIALTADAMADHVEKYKEAGLNAVVAKPIIPAELSQVIDQVSSH